MRGVLSDGTGSGVWRAEIQTGPDNVSDGECGSKALILVANDHLLRGRFMLKMQIKGKQEVLLYSYTVSSFFTELEVAGQSSVGGFTKNRVQY